jgi:hypothetical protein
LLYFVIYFSVCFAYEARRKGRRAEELKETAGFPSVWTEDEEIGHYLALTGFGDVSMPR